MKYLFPHSSWLFICQALVQGKIASPKEENEDVPPIVAKITRKRNQILSRNLRDHTHSNEEEFGDSFFEEDNITWNRILGQTSFAPEHCDVAVDPVACYLASNSSVSCKDYMELIGRDISKQCEEQVVYKYVVRNIGTETDKITKVKTAINSARPFVYIGSSVPWKSRTLNPGQHLTATQDSFYNFCAAYNKNLNFEVGIECADGNSKMFHPKISFEGSLPSCDCNLQLTCTSSEGGPCVPVDQSTSGVCDFHPHYFDVLFSGGLCAGSVNQQGDEFLCIEEGDLTDISKAFIIIRGKSRLYFSGYVDKGEVFTIGHGCKVDSDLKVFIYNTNGGTVLQAFSFHSSCSRSLALNDVFGAITIGETFKFNFDLKHECTYFYPLNEY